MPILDLLMGHGADVGHHDVTGHHANATSFAENGGLEFRDYYASACPHCKHLEGPWKAAMSQYSGPVKWTQIECNDENWAPVPANADKCAAISGFPTLKMFQDGKEVDEYEGGRTVEDLLQYVNNFDASKVAASSMGIVPGLLAAVFSKMVGAEDRAGEEDAEDRTGEEEGASVVGKEVSAKNFF